MKNTFLIIFVASLIFFNSCSDKKKLSANLTGIVSLFAETEMEDASGVTVKITNTNFEAITDKNGNFEIKNVPLGTYEITFSKEGYTTYIYDSYQHIGGADYNNRIIASLIKRSNVKVSDYTVVIDDNKIKCSVTVKDTIPIVYCLFSTTSDISDTLFMDAYPYKFSDNSLTIEKNISFDNLRKNIIFNAGDVIYSVAYTSYTYLWLEDISFIYKKAKLSYEHSEIKQVTVPSDFVSKYPDGYLPPISERDNNNM